MSEQSIGLNYLGWMGSSATECSNLPFGDLTAGVETASLVDQSGASIPGSKPEQAFLFGTELKCGSIVSFASKSDENGAISYTVPNMVAGSLSNDLGRVQLAFPETVNFSDGLVEGINGIYKMTTTFKSNKPTYYNGTYWLWFDGASWVLSTTGMDKAGIFFMNNSTDIFAIPYVDSEGNSGIGGGVPGGALHTEDISGILAVESVDAIITTEG
jgi:hypothetical protein